ncbi:hypothetical protein NBRC116493_32580 [Aurantivibrio infirmus]
MNRKETLDYFDNYSSSRDELYEHRSMLPQQVMRILWDGFACAVDHAETTSAYCDVSFAAQTYSNLVDAAIDLPELQAEYWVGRADDYLPTFWCVWMQWLDERHEKRTRLN